MLAANALTGLWGCTGSDEPSLLADEKSNSITSAGSYIVSLMGSRQTHTSFSQVKHRTYDMQQSSSARQGVHSIPYNVAVADKFVLHK